MILFFIILAIIQITVLSDLSFRLVTIQAPWRPRCQAQLHALQHQITISTRVVPKGSFLMYGGTPVSDLPYNDVWLSSNGSAWTIVNQSQSFPRHSSTYCSDPFSDRSYVILYQDRLSASSNISIWTSQNQTFWQDITPATLLPFINRSYFGCLVDLQSNVYSLTGLNTSKLSKGTQSYNDVWRSGNYGLTWELRTNSPGFVPRYSVLSGIHYNNSHLNNQDIMYIIGGATGDPKIITNDIWVSSDGANTWLLINNTFPWENNVISEDTLIISRDGGPSNSQGEL